MPLHCTQNRKLAAADSAGSAALNTAAASYKFPETRLDSQAVYQAIHNQLILDGDSQQNLATFCTTWIEPEVEQLMDESADKNMIDKDEYPQTAAIEERCVHMLADLWNSPEAACTIGCSTTGSSEAAMLGGLALKWNWRKRRRAQGKSTDAPNLIMGPVQVCWHKFCRYFDVEIREVPMEGSRLLLTPEEVLKRCDENTIGVVVTLGVTFTLQFEPVEAISAALDKLEADTGLSIPIHVDGASGAFLAPFTQPDLLWDFRLPRVKSINTSGHKYGLVYPGVGWIVWRELADLDPDLIFNVDYLGGAMPTLAINFSRPASQIVAQYYNLIRLGKSGYRAIHEACQEVAVELAGQIAELGPFKMLSTGHDLPVIAWTLKDPTLNWSLYDLSDRLRDRGWQVPTYRMPANRQDAIIQRVVVRNGFTHDLASMLLRDIRRHLDWFATQPGFHPTLDGAGYHH
jgi:glutamate decarboxylase